MDNAREWYGSIGACFDYVIALTKCTGLIECFGYDAVYFMLLLHSGLTHCGRIVHAMC